MTMTIGSLFSGMGGLDLAVEQVTGATPAWFCEWDDAPSKILAHHWPEVPNYRDVTQVDWSQVEPVDIITGGYPCQPFSQAGQRKGTGDDRHLWPHVREAISELSPSLVVLENVFGHLTLGFDEVLTDLQILNYETHWTVIRASDVGAPHHRARLFILATKGNHDRPVWSWINRWRRLHRNPAEQGKGKAQCIRGTVRCDGGQGTSSSTENVGQVRREHHATQGGKREELPRCMAMGSDRSEGIECAQRSVPGSDRQARCGEYCAANAVDDRQGGETSERERNLDSGDEGLGGHICGSGQRNESERPGPQLPGCATGCHLPCGGLVGTERRSFWPCSLSGEVAEEWLHGVREDIFPPLPGGAGTYAPLTHTDCFGLETGHICTWGYGPQVSRVNSSGETLSHTPSIRREWARSPWEGGSGFTDCHNRDVEWGEYAPAVRRWERIVGPAPAPTELNSNGNPRLNAAFAEWMMGLLAGHVTAPEIGLTRAQQLKALGNGVVPQQAEAALRSMLSTPGMLGAA